VKNVSSDLRVIRNPLTVAVSIKKKFMHQHWVPASYLRAWHDPASAHLQNPYVWRFSKDGSEIRAKSPQNLIPESDMYTFVDKDGRRDLTIERGLGRLEDMFERLRRDKIMRCEPLADEEKTTLFLFVATARFRTSKSRDHWRRQLGEAVELGDRMKAHIESMSAEQKAALENFYVPSGGPIFSLEDLRALAEQPLQLMLPAITTAEAKFLSGMTTTIFCTSSNPGFITSDAPVVWFDPELYRQPPFYRNLALGSPTIEVTMPIAPSRFLLLTHDRATEGYVDISAADNVRVNISAVPTHLVGVLNRLSAIGTELIDEVNRRTRFHCDEHFVSSSNQKKDIWFDPGTPPPEWQDEWRKQS
jgi:hypothetical protein